MPSACLDLLVQLRRGAVRARECRSQRPRARRDARRRLVRDELGPERLAVVAEWPLRLRARRRRRRDVLSRHATLRRRSRHAADARRRARGRCWRGRRRTSSSPGTRTSRSTGVAGGTPVRRRRQRRQAVRGQAGRVLGLLGDDVELPRTDYDVESAPRAIRATDFPDADEHAENLLEPHSADEVSAYFESIRGA